MLFSIQMQISNDRQLEKSCEGNEKIFMELNVIRIQI